jgi:hypothetical protein
VAHHKWLKAEKWGVGIMQESGADKAWLQECMVPHWVRGGKDMTTCYYGGDPKFVKSLDVLALGNSEGTKNKNLTATVV